ncbi:hypothetical protein B0H63DRAFT_106267 [Podospora didyma]|uniref:Uncharacterized protein n=1 Tax=Podospora didyma TaxID=330526 RepID=A0AAE0U484_9PEZI|nr:hypothetical protein B0H63DRAFT_106267 [Podospora didyma]
MPTWKFDASVTDFQQAAGASLPPTPGLATLLEEPAAEQKPDSEPRPPLLTSMSTGEIVNQISKTYTYWEDLPPVKDKGGDRTIALFMPFLAFESHRGRNDMTMDRLKTEKEMENLIKDELRYTELWNPDHTRPLHYRRTLDQYSYYMLDSTERRDWDQVMYRWAKLKAVKARQTFEPDEAPILMVDQLWMWVLPDGTVVTSIPSTQKPAKYSLEKVLEAEFWSKSRHAIKGPESLFSLVLRQCVNVMKREGPCKLNLQESFQSAINNLAESEAVKMKELLKVVKKLKKEPDPFRLTADIDKFSQISEEMYQLVEIVDIQDELAIINSVLTAQKSVLRDLRDHVCCERKPSSTDPPNSIYVMKDQSPPTVAIRKTAVDDSIRIVDENIRAVKEMAESAKRVHTDVSGFVSVCHVLCAC